MRYPHGDGTVAARFNNGAPLSTTARTNSGWAEATTAAIRPPKECPTSTSGSSANSRSVGISQSAYNRAPPATVGGGEEPKPGKSSATEAIFISANSRAAASKS